MRKWTISGEWNDQCGNDGNSHSSECIKLSVLDGIWWPNLHVIEEAMLDPTGDVPSEHTGAGLLRRSFLLFALELALRTHTHTRFSVHIHIHSLSAFFTLLHQSVPKLFPYFGEFPRLYSLAQVDTGADYFSVNPSCLPSVCKACTLKRKPATVLFSQWPS